MKLDTENGDLTVEKRLMRKEKRLVFGYLYLAVFKQLVCKCGVNADVVDSD